MEWTADYDPFSATVRATVRGEYTVDHGNTMMRELAGFARQHGASRFLVDLREASIVMSAADIRARPTFYAEIGLTRGTRLAVVFASWTADAVFLEATIDRGEYPRKVFVDAMEATRWLRSARP